MKTVVVIGAGAAGMMAASTAADRGLNVILLEKNHRVGRKICLLYTSDAADEDCLV